MKSCVIEIQDNAVIGLSICQDAKQAREVFTATVKENTDLTAEEIKAALDGDGVVTVGEGSVCLFGGHEIPRDDGDHDNYEYRIKNVECSIDGNDYVEFDTKRSEEILRRKATGKEIDHFKITDGIECEDVPEGQQEYSITGYYRDNDQPYDDTATAKNPEAAAALCAWQCGQDNDSAQLTVVTVRDAKGMVCDLGSKTLDFTFGSADPCPVNDAGELTAGHGFKEGDRVQWTDPADEHRSAEELSEEGTASGPGTITHVQHEDDDAVISINKDDGGSVEAFPSELEKLAAFVAGQTVGECALHGEFKMDAPDSPCPACEDGLDADEEPT